MPRRKTPSHSTVPDSFLASFSLLQRLATHRLVRNLFDAILLYYVDRFDDQDLDRAAEVLARWAMAPRVQHVRVTRQMVSNYALGAPPADNLPQENLFAELRLAMRSQDFLRQDPPGSAAQRLSRSALPLRSTRGERMTTTASRDVEPLTVRDVFARGRYVVPVYQRAYAWGESQILTLLAGRPRLPPAQGRELLHRLARDPPGDHRFRRRRDLRGRRWPAATHDAVHHPVDLVRSTTTSACRPECFRTRVERLRRGISPY